MNESLNQFDRRAMRRRFAGAAATFSEADFVHERCADGLLQRMAPLSCEPELVVDLGSGTGTLTRKLSKHFPKAQVIALDSCLPMLDVARRRRFWQRPLDALVADVTALPFRSQSVDLITANLVLPWLDAPDRWAQEIQRVLKPDGVVFFSSLGPASFAELRTAWANIDEQRHVANFVDMHDLGDSLGRAGLRDPVLDTDFLNLSYRSPEALWRDIKNSGCGNSLADRRPTLTGKGRLAAVTAQLRALEPLQISLELVYGHAFGNTIVANSSTNGEVRVNIGTVSTRTARG